MWRAFTWSPVRSCTWIRCSPNCVSTGCEISPTGSEKAAESNAPTICPRPKVPRSPPFWALPGSWLSRAATAAKSPPPTSSWRMRSAFWTAAWRSASVSVLGMYATVRRAVRGRSKRSGFSRKKSRTSASVTFTWPGASLVRSSETYSTVARSFWS